MHKYGFVSFAASSSFCIVDVDDTKSETFSNNKHLLTYSIVT